jgi:hypothetical protein
MDGRTTASAEKRRHINFMLLVSVDDSAMEVNSNAREYDPRPAGQAMLATGGGVLARLNVATSCSARKDDARRVALILVVGVVVMMM